MRKLAGSLALVAVLTLGLPAMPAGKSGTEAAAELLTQLGSRKYAQREAAARKLEALGESALPALRRALATADLEVRRRAESLIVRIEHRAEATRLLTGKRIRLVYKDAPLAQAIEDLAVRTGFDIRLSPDETALIDKRLTLDTGETTLWQALHKFCRQAGLSELNSQASASDDVGEDAIRLTGERIASLPTHLAGAVRVRALPLSGAKGGPQGALGFRLEASPEPGMPWQGVVGVRIVRAIDDRGQELKQAVLAKSPSIPERPVAWDGLSGGPVAIPADRRVLPVWLSPGKQSAARLREVQGSLVVQVPVSRQLLAVDAIDNGQGKTYNGIHGHSLTVLKVARAPESLKLRLQIKRWRSGGTSFQVTRTKKGTLVMRGGQSGPPIRFTLLDASGTVLQPRTSQQVFLPKRGAAGLLMEFQVTFALKPGQAPADRLVCSGPITTLLEIPFMLRDVPLAPAVRANAKAQAKGYAPR